ncbi:Na+/H+ antiporter NhaA [Propionibacterium freudenreichii]|uniref:Na+/H+ antiporter NhaA n=1 Tax=Propionibacterium freudenreichii TaxID=1744 RepID=UPI0005427EE9|nr:Na+/H+ antiporter NhaA [Propionibacterium freudenreichii]MCT2975496.1 Na+/H+ antiporter NhaA [Propionibacterium freudenreichii]MDK9319153.1 Na+/H+ antiporter NhaA [Propionibacterium freudenreichii]MDK9346703.1 Na+/H+ antiporter NhaA [Propionibacterium freudenreichii]MDK9350033.1 Na+/H+ antiporter NhaA [Propionibacterium freudenreichii]MDK9670322.1 Na+/H+ antiporter NhaA [Propionibacterium freudenreichii]
MPTSPTRNTHWWPRLRAPRRHSHANALHLADALRTSTVGGLIMLAAAAVAIVWACLSQSSYHGFTQFQLGSHTIAGWVSDGLLTVFFFVAGLELKREFTEGSLRRPVDAVVPIVAAAAGMIVPAGCYLLVNVLGHGELRGWTIPMATDIAFALAVLAIAGKSMPPSLRAFLLTLAVVDDLGSILVIAVVFTDTISWGWLAGSLAAMALWWLGQRRHIDNGWLYLPLGALAWWCMLNSGIHPTLAGVAVGLLTRNTAEGMAEPLDRWKATVEPWSAGLVVPLFALVSAGVHVDASLLRAIWTQPVALGILAGLVVGKPLGILAGTMLTVRHSPAELGRGLGGRDVVAAGQLGGVGLTISLLMCELCFADNAQLLDEAKAAVLLASVISAVLASVLLRRRVRAHRAADA